MYALYLDNLNVYKYLFNYVKHKLYDLNIFQFL